MTGQRAPRAAPAAAAAPATRRPADVAGRAAAALLTAGACTFFALQARTWAAAGLDAGIYREAGRALVSGRDVFAGRFGGPGVELPFTYPPFALLVLLPLAALSRTGAQVAMFAASFSALVLVVRWCLEHALTRTPRWWAAVVWAAPVSVALEPVRSTLGLGQVNLLLLALVLGLDVRVTRWSTRWAGVGAGVAAAIKVTPGLLVVAQLVRGRRLPFARGVAAALACTLLGLAVSARGGWRFFTALMWDPSRTGDPAYLRNQSLRGMLARAVPGHAGAYAAVASLVVLAVAARGVRAHRDDAWCALTVAAVAGLLVSPIAWTHHWVWVLPAAAIGVRHRRDRPAYAVAGGVLVAPALLTSVLWAGASPPVWSHDLYTVAALVWLAVLALVPAPALEGDPSAHPAPSVSR